MKAYPWIILGLLGSLTLSPAARAAEEPQLKFEPEAETQAQDKEKKEPAVYGDKPIAKFGNEQNYFKLGGYGSMRFSADTGEDLNSTFTLRRFVLTTDALIASKFRIYSELEFERFRKIELERQAIAQEGGITLEQEIEGTNQSEIALEQIWFQLEFADYIRFQGGGVLVPVGRFNINHDDNAWNIPRRPLVDRGIPVLPATSAWDELGLGLNGDVAIGENAAFNYRIYVVNGATLDFELEEVIKTRDPQRDELELEGEFGISTGTFSQDIKDAKAVTGRVAFSPALGHEIGLSGYWGRYTPDFLIGKNLTSLGFDFLSNFKSFAMEGEFVFTDMGGLDAVLTDFAAVAGTTEAEVESEDSPDLETKIAFKPSLLSEKKYGYWLEFRYSFRPRWLTQSWFGRHFSDPQLIPVLRVEQAFLNGHVTEFEALDGVVTVLEKENRRVDRITGGLAFRLNPLAVFQLVYEFTNTNSGKSLASVTNFLPTPSSQNQAVLFGAAFGF
jgi:hypothetical protein